MHLRELFLGLYILVGFTLPAQAAPRTVFVQLFEWPWNDVARECENYLGPAGFSAVQVSPPNEHLSLPNHPWWERYQPVSYKLESRGGTEIEFRNMVARCRAVGVDIYADAVINHMSAYPSGVGFAGTKFSTYNYPGLFSFKDFHHCGRHHDDGIRDYEDTYELQNCELLGLDDLDTGSIAVQTTIAKYLNRLLDIGVKGFRIDAAKHIAASEINEILSYFSKPAYIFQELILSSTDRLSRKDYLPNGDITIHPYPFQVGYAFKNRAFGQLPQILQQDIDSKDAVIYIENHDLQRWPDQEFLLHYTTHPDLYRLAQAFILAWPYGYPHLYSGYQFSHYDESPPLGKDGYTQPILDSQGQCRQPWLCEHRLPEVAPMIYFRNETNNAFYVTKWWTNGKDQMAFARGSLGHVLINASHQTMKGPFRTELPEGEYCNLLEGRFMKTRRCVSGFKVDANHMIHIEIPPLTAAAFLAKESL